MDAGQDQDPDRPPVPQVDDADGDLADATQTRLESSGSVPSCPRARRGSGGRLGEGGVAASGKSAVALGAWIVFEDAAGFSTTPPTSRTWSRRGSTPVIRVRGRSQRRFSIAALCCYKPGMGSRLIYRPKRHTDHKAGGRKSFAWTEYRDLLIAAHQQLGGPIVLAWDNLNVHKHRRMRAFIEAQDWLTAYHLPSYAPDLNPVEGIWSILRRTTQANTAFADSDHLMRRLRHGLRRIQYRSDSSRDASALPASPHASFRQDHHVIRRSICTS